MAGVSGQQRLTIRCPKCCKGHRSLGSRSVRSWPGWEFTALHPLVKRTGRSDGRNIKTQIRCKRCEHTWWTVMFWAINRAAELHGFSQERGTPSPRYALLKAMERGEI